MATINFDIPDDKVDVLLTATGLLVEEQTAAERVETMNAWAEEMVRQHLWDYERSEAARAVVDPMPAA